ncbi:MAG TPA: GNAT family N-acetyltransferase [Steroidobacteraceae bacterium]
MNFELQPSLKNELVRIAPLRPGDFEALYAVASDPLIWEQHPSRDRYKREVFENFFKGAIESGGAFRVIDATNDELIGSSRYYDHDAAKNSVSIGYTFIARSRWAKGFNRALKDLMLDHAFRFVEQVTFEVGADNWRSRKAMEKLGGLYIAERSVSYYGEPPRLNVIFRIDKNAWEKSGRR